MASITTILGTDSVSSSRIVLNGNFGALNNELSEITELLNTSAQSLTLTGLITGGTLKVHNNTGETFKVNIADAVVNVPITFNQDVTIQKGLMHSVYYDATTLPNANSYEHSTYVLNPTATGFPNPVTLAAADNGQEITLISNGGSTNIAIGNILGPTAIVILTGGSLTLRYITNISKFVIVSSNHCTITY